MLRDNTRVIRSNNSTDREYSGQKIKRGRRGRDRMVVTTTYAINAYHHWSGEFESHSGELYSIKYYVIKFVSDLQQFGGFLRALRFPPPINWPTRYNWNIVESGVKYNNLQPERKRTKWQIRVIKKLPNSEQSFKGEVKTHKYINRQNQSTSGWWKNH